MLSKEDSSFSTKKAAEQELCITKPHAQERCCAPEAAPSSGVQAGSRAGGPCPRARHGQAHPGETEDPNPGRHSYLCLPLALFKTAYKLVLKSPCLHLEQRMYLQPWGCGGRLRLRTGKLFSSHLNGSFVQLLRGNKNSLEKATAIH